MNADQRHVDGPPMCDRRATGSHQVASVQARPVSGIVVPLDKLFDAAMAFWEEPSPSQRQAPRWAVVPPLAWCAGMAGEDLETTGGWKLEGAGPSLELVTAEVGNASAAARAPQETSRLSMRLLVPALVALLATVGVDAYLARGPHYGRLEQVTGSAVGMDEAGRPATAGQAEADAEASAAADHEWVAGSASLGALAPASRIDAIDWAQRGSDTVITVRGNGRLSHDAISLHSMDGPPRLLVKLSGIEEQYSRYQIPVGTPAVAQIRVGHHPELTPSCLYVVLDLAQHEIEVSDLELEDGLVKVVVRPN